MKRAVIFHGTGGSPEENWFPWLKEELERDGWKVWVPALPGNDYPSTERYNEYLLAQDWDWQDNLLIGHSSGSVAILGLLPNLPADVIIKDAYLVAAFKDNLGWKDDQGKLILGGLFQQDYDWAAIRKRSNHFTLIHSTDDPHCPPEHASYLAVKLKGELILTHGEKHFSTESDPKHIQCPLLLDHIKQHHS